MRALVQKERSDRVANQDIRTQLGEFVVDEFCNFQKQWENHVMKMPTSGSQNKFYFIDLTELGIWGDLEHGAAINKLLTITTSRFSDEATFHVCGLGVIKLKS